MNKLQETPTQIQAISEKVELLHKSSKEMIDVMERQIEAIISSNTQKIDELATLHATLTVNYNETEQEFIEELSGILSIKKSKGLRLVALKEHFPEFATQIDNWQALLHHNLLKLQAKHRQVVELLEFAMSNNAKMMETLYSKHNEVNTHYSSKGNRAGMLPGVAINQQA